MREPEETDRRAADLRDLFELGVLTFDELRVELAAEPQSDKDGEITFRVRRTEAA